MPTAVSTLESVLAKLVVAALAALFSSVNGFATIATADEVTDEMSVMRCSPISRQHRSAMVNEPLTGEGLPPLQKKFRSCARPPLATTAYSIARNNPPA